MKQHIALIGFPTTGKTTLGKALAKTLGWAFIDTDTVIENRTGQSVRNLVQKLSQDQFMAIETHALSSLAPTAPTIIATGGSVVYSERGMSHLKQIANIIWMRDEFENIEDRIKKLPERGIVGHANKSLKTLFEERNPLYDHYADAHYWLSYPIDVESISKDLCNLYEQQFKPKS